MKWLLIACIIVCGAAIMFSPITHQSQDDTKSRYQTLLPELKQHINDVDRITVQRGDEDITLYMDNAQQWRVKEAENYPASSTEIRKLLLYLSQSQLRNTKTANPELLPRLKLDDEQVSVLTLWRGDDILHRILLGKITPEKTGTYVRLSSDESQSYVASGRIEVSTNPLDWLFYDLFSINTSRVRNIEYALDGYKPYRHTRSSPDTALMFEPLAGDKELQQRYQILSPAAFIEKLNFTDVVPIAKADGEALGTIVVTTFDGLNITFTLYQVEYQQYFAISATADEAMYQKVNNTMQDFTITRQEAAAINERTAGWLYQLGQYHTNQLTKSYFDMVQDKTDTQGNTP